jgi:hypothetical protein
MLKILMKVQRNKCLKLTHELFGTKETDSTFTASLSCLSALNID